MALSPATIQYDSNGNPVAATPASALASAQSALVTVGSDYATTALARIPKVDSLGQQYAVPVAPGGAVLPLGVNAPGANTGVYGQVSLAWDATNGYWRPFQVDATGAGVVRNALANTCTFAPTAVVNTGSAAGKSMISIYNATSSLYFRCSALFLMCPPQAAVTGGLLQTSTSYTTIGMQVARFTTAHTGGTVIPPAYHDSRTVTDANITARTGATIAGQQAAALRVMDAAYSSTYPYLTRSDPGMQLPTFGPGEGVTIQVLSALGGSGVNFYVTAIIAQNTA